MKKATTNNRISTSATGTRPRGSNSLKYLLSRATTETPYKDRIIWRPKLLRLRRGISNWLPKRSVLKTITMYSRIKPNPCKKHVTGWM